MAIFVHCFWKNSQAGPAGQRASRDSPLKCTRWRLFVQHLQFCIRSVILLRFHRFTDRVLGIADLAWSSAAHIIGGQGAGTVPDAILLLGER